MRFRQLLRPFENQAGKRGQGEIQAAGPAVACYRLGLKAAGITHIGAAIQIGIAVERFLIPPGFRHAHAVARVRHGGEIADNDQAVLRIFRLAHKCHDA